MKRPWSYLKGRNPVILPANPVQQQIASVLSDKPEADKYVPKAFEWTLADLIDTALEQATEENPSNTSIRMEVGRPNYSIEVHYTKREGVPESLYVTMWNCPFSPLDIGGWIAEGIHAYGGRANCLKFIKGSQGRLIITDSVGEEKTRVFGDFSKWEREIWHLLNQFGIDRESGLSGLSNLPQYTNTPIDMDKIAQAYRWAVKNGFSFEIYSVGDNREVRIQTYDHKGANWFIERHDWTIDAATFHQMQEIITTVSGFKDWSPAYIKSEGRRIIR
ncbi:MAG TPA: hypothetical protein VFF28_00150 [Candidatus Nanoarchaeia archaeon]|nr:hypothetical protein [Candidatus Nanoarchaeia archaeon]